ncbi:hypothetical protein L3X38_031904 [Prunus dulcis]|uniref:Uncharacterized protein n=1 Tax=Prunus dulcis TaxID=3755 RepID=A0AAD4VFA2_PRUDU|nr:hypothetical protein L3X38_031904 [Prunus dulcis]
MAEKQSKQQGKPPIRQLPATMIPVKIEQPSQVIPYPGYSPIQISNRYATLGSTVSNMRPNYQSALISSYDAFQVVTHSPTSSPIGHTKSSPYFPKSSQIHFLIEPCFNHLANPVKIAKSYFPPNFHYMPPHSSKSLKYYRDILLETQSLEMRPIKDRNYPNIILYHSMYIKSILSQSEWGEHPYYFKAFNSSLQYSYYDYIEAWHAIFLHQTKDFSHSWKIQVRIKRIDIQASQMNDEDDDDDASPKSQSSSSQPQNPSSQKDFTQKFCWVDYPDSQESRPI